MSASNRIFRIYQLFSSIAASQLHLLRNLALYQIDICSSPAQRLWAQVLVTQLFGCITAHVIILTHRQQHHIVRGMTSIEHIYIQSIAHKHSLSRETNYHVKRCMFTLICMTYLCLPYCIIAPWHLPHLK